MISPSSKAQVPVFSIVISEKGGSERREAYEQAEINIGRVQGNELMLPKGNVSKRHARLLYRDGRFIVTDLNSTNGTYVNRRRISQATIVREGDRVYIGDFVLRVELPERTRSSGQVDHSDSAQVERGSRADASQPDHSSVTHAPSEDSGGDYPDVPGPPRVPSARGSGQHQLEPSGGARSGPRGTEQLRESSVERSQPGSAEAPVDPSALAVRQALAALADHVTKAVNVSALDGGEAPDESLNQSIMHALNDGFKTLQEAGSIPSDASRDLLVDHVRRELMGHGPISDALGDDQVDEITVPSFDSVFVQRNGQRISVEPPFSSDAALRRVVARLCIGTAAPLGDETIVERALPGGASLSAVVGGLSGSALVVRKTRPVRSTLDELVRNGAVSRAMARFLQQCVQARANLLVAGPRGSSTAAVVSALVGASSGPLLSLEAGEPLVADRSAVTRVDVGRGELDVERLLSTMAGAAEMRVVADAFGGRVGAASLDAIAGGADGFVAVARVPSLRRGLDRVVAGIASAAGPGALPGTVRDALVASFDLALEVAQLRDGRVRVMRIAELSIRDGNIEAKDVFSFNFERTAAGGAVEGTFHPSGKVPRIVEEMAARGISVESAMFSRPPSR